MNTKARSRLCLLLVLALSIGFSPRAFAADPSYLEVSVAGGEPLKRGEEVKGAWKITCYVDEMEGRRYCTLRQDLESDETYATQSTFHAMVNNNGVIYLNADGADPYPGTQQTFKIDEAAPRSFTADRGIDGRSTGLLAQLQKGNILRTRWYEWPYRNQHDEVISLKSFTKAIEVARAAVKRQVLPISPEEARVAAWDWASTIAYCASYLSPENYDPCRQAREGKELLEKLRRSLAPGYLIDFDAGFASWKYGGGYSSKRECEEHLDCVRRGLDRYALLPTLPAEPMPSQEEPKPSASESEPKPPAPFN